jgi:hypothetical protein
MVERDRLNALRASLAEADAQIDRGECVLWTPDLLVELTREADELARRGAIPHPDVWPKTGGHPAPTDGR